MSQHAGRKNDATLPALVELQARNQWVCWRKEQRDKKPTKVPYNPETGRWARSNDPDTWTSYARARSAYERSQTTKRPYDGIGYMFNRDITGIDLDHCIAEDGTLDAWAESLIERLASYTEQSPGGEGFHILVHGAIPEHRGRKQPVPASLRPRHREAVIEMYDCGRFFTVTGRHLAGTPDSIEDRHALVQVVYAEMFTERGQHSSSEEQGFPTWEPPDKRLLDKAMHAKNGAAFRALWNGDSSGYVSQSEAELALCTLLAFWTGNDAHEVDRLFRCSALFRPQKWDRPARSGETYGEGTIARAIAGCQETYTSPATGKIIHFRRRPEEGDALSESISLPETQLDFVLACLQDEEEGDGRLFAHLFRGKCVYDHTEGVWYEWQGHSWRRDACKHSLLLASGPLASVYLDASAQLAEEAAQAEKRLDPDLLKYRKGDDPFLQRYEWLKVMIGTLIGRAKALKRLKRAQAVLTFAQAYLRITSGEWDTHPWLLACENGVLDLQQGVLQPGNPEDYLKTVIPTVWTSLDAPAPRWEQFLREIFQDRPPQERDTLVAFFHRLLGYGITGSTVHHVFTILYGEEGRNGKDTLLDTLKDVLGPLVGAVSNDLFVAQDKFRASGAPTPHLCDLQGKRLVWGSETRQGDKLHIAQIKLLSGGGEISTRQLHGRQYSFTPTHKLLLMTNYKPHADARDAAFWSRACLVEFSMRFLAHPRAPHERQADPSLKEKLRQERSGILAWLVRGCLAFQEVGLAIPASVSLATEKYRDEEDRILHFLNDSCMLLPEAFVKASALYSAYKDWCEENHYGRAMNATLFGNEIGKRFEKKRGKSGLTYQGVRLLTAQEQSVGGVYTSSSSAHVDERPLKDTSQDVEQGEGVGCVGLHQVFSQNTIEGYSIGQNREKPYTPYTSSTIVNVFEVPPEASGDHKIRDEKPYINPIHPTTTPEEWEEFVL